MFNNFINGVRSRPELIILSLIVVILAMLFVPLPTILVDMLIAINIVISLVVLMSSFYIQRILNFSSFPSLLLITTLFRLALSISTSRLILLEADAGHIVATFGDYVIGDSLVVGFVIFSIVTVVQFIVITKGSERVAEVAARFSLDGMPGKQMGIDADLRAGSIDAAGAAERRSNLEMESQLYGSFDGAMKFIKGDAIAGIIIIFVNFIGGISVGMVQLDMSFSEALKIYTMLTIGDGLVAQIPALLIAIGAGFVVTRVNGEDKNLGENIVNQLFQNSFVILAAAVLTLAMGMLPGFPLGVFVVLSAGLGWLYWSRIRKERSANASKTNGTSTLPGAIQGNPTAELDTSQMITATVPLIFLVDDKHKEQWESAKFLDFIRNRFFLDYGIRLPAAVTRYTSAGPVNRVSVFINEVRAAELQIVFGAKRVLDSNDEVETFDIGLHRAQDSGGKEVFWVDMAKTENLEKMGYVLRSDLDELYLNVAVVLARHVQEFFGIQEAKNLLDELEPTYPELLKETYRYASVQKIAEIVQRLMMERISVRNMKLILEALAKVAAKEKDVMALVEHVRVALGRYISDKFAVGGKLRAIAISPGIEETVRQGIRQTPNGVFLNLEPRVVEELLDHFAVGLNSIAVSHKDLVLLASVDVRRFIKRLVETRYADLEVLSFGEITDAVTVDVLKTI